MCFFLQNNRFYYIRTRLNVLERILDTRLISNPKLLFRFYFIDRIHSNCK